MCLMLMATGGILFVAETMRPVTYLKRSRRARRSITLTKGLIILGMAAIIFGLYGFFINHMLF